MSAQLPPALAGLRLGCGYALVELGAQRPLRLAGEDFDGLPGAEGEADDDGDCACRAVVEALLNACALPGLATVFPEEHPDRYFADGLVLLSRTASALSRSSLAGVLQCHVQVWHAQPKLLLARQPVMRHALARALQVAPAQLSLGIDSLPGQLAHPVPGEAAAQATLLCVLSQGSAVREPREELPRSKGELQSILRELEAPEPVAAGSGWRGTQGMVEEEELMPVRARKFEEVLTTKLHPLPQAPPPRAGELLIVYTDGASRGNPGPASAGFCVMNAVGQVVHEAGVRLGTLTNNQAEYRAVLEAAKWIEAELGRELRIELRLDSQLVQRQLIGEYRIKDEGLKPLALQAMALLMGFAEFKAVHIPREQNARADALANQALDAK